MTALLFRLAFAGIRSRLLASALTIAIAGAAAATIVLALEVRSSGRDPWQQTFDAANGAHVLALVPSQADALALAALPGRYRARRAGSSREGDPGAAWKYRSSGPRRPEWSHSREHTRADRRLAAARAGASCSNAASQCTRHRGRRNAGAHDPTRLGRPSGSRDGGRTQPAALPSPQPRACLDHARHARANRAGSHAAGAGQRRFDWRIPPRLRLLPSGRLQACRRPRCSPALSPSSPGRTSATTHWPMHSQLSSS